MTTYKIKECYRQEGAQVEDGLNTIKAMNLENAKRTALRDKAFSRTILVLANESGAVVATYKNGSWK